MDWGLIEDIVYGIASLLVGIGAICIPIAIYKGIKYRTDLKKLELEKHILELEVEKSRTNQQTLELQKLTMELEVEKSRTNQQMLELQKLTIELEVQRQNNQLKLANIPAEVPEDLHVDARTNTRTSVHVDMVAKDEQQKTLFLHKALFSQRDVEILQSILAGDKYESIAVQQGISPSSVKKRVKFLYERLNQLDRESFMSVYADYTIELAVPSPKSEPANNVSQFSLPQNSNDSNEL